MEDEIKENPQLLDKKYKENFFERIFSPFQKKSGYDFYPWIALIQVIILFYIDSSSEGIQNSIKYNQLSGNMVIVLFIQIIIMVSERYITLRTCGKIKESEVDKIQDYIQKQRKEQENKLKKLKYQNRQSQVFKDEIEKPKEKQSFEITQIMLKYIQLTIVLVLFLYFVYLNIPQPFQRNIDGQFKKYTTNSFLSFFYFLYCIYFTLSGLQIKYGYNKFKIRNTLMQYQTSLAGICLKVFRAIPFMQQLKVVMDWTFTATTLDLFQWFKIEDIHFTLYCAKLDSIVQKNKPVGQNTPWFMKLSMGWVLLILIILLIFGPMLLFSSLNPTTQLNSITNAKLELGLLFGGIYGVYYPLYLNQNVKYIQTVDDEDLQNFKNITQISQSDKRQFQTFVYSSSSDDNWTASKPNKDEIKMILNQTINQQIKNQVNDLNSQPSTFYYPFNTKSLDSMGTSMSLEQINQLYQIINCNATSPLLLNNLYLELLRLDTNGKTYKARPFYSIDYQSYIKDAYFNLICLEHGKITQAQYFDLQIVGGEQGEGLNFYVLCDKYSSFFMGFSIITIYTSVILVIGQFIKTIFSGDIQIIVFSDLPNSDKLLKICDAIAVARAERDLIKENLLYYELIDLLRSPEVIKMITGSYAETIQNKSKQEAEEVQKIKLEEDNKKNQ
ncbi:hypothetical protein IMG5_203790 [Ichthyophthirius multifiliis]|uniref:Piezo non-specific cation channel R-Ras-binding domain-containing protein n=1 Tax=Ichthyophthirius multifiliis TaxID=5932 RepID=G0R6D7_ICHMU|nr:hypothetical protein IMG5_203790 [Ichthyophthirius multifiliis]EGR26980.1 hypothetical protein IMG5_203790 [Ichthyophthirius multifiliis]|eukprot:XP_004023864.1 hypothetical protein IMG5_203790 [Ichthyophthirius multifiliis]